MWKAIGQGIKTVAGTALGIGSGMVGAEQQLKNQQKLNKEQHERNKELTEIGKQNQLDIWNKTNYGAQVEHMKNAGLNPSLMYGMGGGGGTTAGSGSVASGSGGNAAALDIGSGAQAALMTAQLDNIKADTEKKKAEAGGIEEDTAGTALDNELKSRTMTDMVTMAFNNAGGAYESYKGMRLANEWEEWVRSDESKTDGQSIKEREARAGVNETIAKIAKLNQEFEKIGKEFGVMDANIANLASDTALRKQMKDHLTERNVIELNQMQTDLDMALKELERMKHDPSYSKYGQYLNYTMDRIEQAGGIIGEVRGWRSKIQTEARSEHNTDAQGNVSTRHTTTTRRSR